MFTYKPLWKQLVEKDMTKTELRKKVGFSSGTLAVMGRNDYIAMSIIDKICQELDCKIEEVIEFVKEG